MDRKKVIRGLHDIGGFIAGRIGIEQARNFLRTIDDAIDLLKEQEHKDNCPCTKCECYECIEVCDEYREWYQKEKA